MKKLVIMQKIFLFLLTCIPSFQLRCADNEKRKIFYSPPLVIEDLKDGGSFIPSMKNEENPLVVDFSKDKNLRESDEFAGTTEKLVVLRIHDLVELGNCFDWLQERLPVPMQGESKPKISSVQFKSQYCFSIAASKTDEEIKILDELKKFSQKLTQKIEEHNKQIKNNPVPQNPINPVTEVELNESSVLRIEITADEKIKKVITQSVLTSLGYSSLMTLLFLAGKKLCFVAISPVHAAPFILLPLFANQSYVRQWLKNNPIVHSLVLLFVLSTLTLFYHL
jgi:hypothetical protein